ncbi:MAG: hypothetical protein H0W72_12275 [Planctomycetes bacterium]|nr:hypothetical protein [Planctomycetota bacterium]
MTTRRFTVAGSDALERRLTELMSEVGDRLRDALPARDVRCSALIGGYGRGEGGVVVEDGEERPHNNFDLLIVAEAHAHRRQAELKVAAERAIALVARAARVAIDVGTTSVRNLRWSVCLVMWYDMRFGHRLVLGDADYLPGLTRFTVERIDPRDVRSLLVNRGTLLVLNRLLDAGDPVHRMAMLRHAMKAVIGFGDALLFSVGSYHWSYVEKRARMRACRVASGAFRDLYDQAAAFRFRPDYAAWAATDVRAWLDGIIPELAKAHQQVEATLLARPPLPWSDYPGALSRAALSGPPSGPRALVRRARSLMGSRPCPFPASTLARWGWRCLGASGQLAAAFPGVAYPSAGDASRSRSAAILGCSTGDAALTRAFLGRWGRDADSNFSAALRRFGVTLEGQP